MDKKFAMFIGITIATQGSELKLTAVVYSIAKFDMWQTLSFCLILMLPSDAETTNLQPVWQTAWTSEYLGDERFEKYAAKANGKLVALAAL